MSTENQDLESTVTKEQVIEHLTEQIEVMKLRAELQELHAAYSMARAEEIKAIAFIGQMTNPPKEDNSLTQEESKKLKKTA